jgi:hypothetical protein
MVKCYNCNSVAKVQCVECQRMVCRSHSSIIFNEESRTFRNLCGACYSQVRRLSWVRERS